MLTLGLVLLIVGLILGAVLFLTRPGGRYWY